MMADKQHRGFTTPERAFYAVVKMTIVRQVEFYAPPYTSNEQLAEQVERHAKRQFGSADEIEIVEMDFR